METKNKNGEKFSQTITFKGLIIGVLTLVLLIPGEMIQSLISERKVRSQQTIKKINSKWSNSQTFIGPVLTVPYTLKSVDDKNVENSESHVINFTPEMLYVKAKLFPEEKHFGIFKSILYKSEMQVSGKFKKIDIQNISATDIDWEKSYFSIGISDLRGVTNNIDFEVNGLHFTAEAGGINHVQIGHGLVIYPKNIELLQSGNELSFNFTLKLNGSSNLNFIPIGNTTKVEMKGAWNSPGFIGSFTPEHSIDKNGFNATWNILHFNRTIPESWVDSNADSFKDTSFGVNLVDTIDHYQQNERSAKYALMFIALTFVVFFFVEILTKKKIHPIQYLLVGIALILFYSLLLSMSEQMSFGLSYVIASLATVGLISLYAHSIFKNKFQTGILTFILSLLYLFLYVILQLEDIALLIGSIGLFLILGVIMFISKKINWYKIEED